MNPIFLSPTTFYLSSQPFTPFPIPPTPTQAYQESCGIPSGNPHQHPHHHHHHPAHHHMASLHPGCNASAAAILDPRSAAASGLMEHPNSIPNTMTIIKTNSSIDDPALDSSGVTMRNFSFLSFLSIFFILFKFEKRPDSVVFFSIRFTY